VAIIVILVLGVLVVMGYFFRKFHVSNSQAKQQAKSDSVMHIQDAHVHNDVHNVIVPNSAQK
jgi:flagellar basal body-associated protein FliL